MFILFQGDSGGSLIVENWQGRMFQAGKYTQFTKDFKNKQLATCRVIIKAKGKHNLVLQKRHCCYLCNSVSKHKW